MIETALHSKNSIPTQIFDFYNYLMDNYLLPELRNRIIKNENEILRETFQRGWLEFFKSKQKAHFNIITTSQKNSHGVYEEKLKVYPAAFKLESVETHFESTEKIITPKSTKKTPHPVSHLKEVREKKTNAIISLSTTYSSTEKLLSIKPFSVEIKYANKTENEFLHQLKTDLSVVQNNFECFYTTNMFLTNFFDTLAANGYIVIDGKDVAYMATIYPNIAKYYPDFSKLKKHKQLVLLQQAAIKGRKSSKKDIYTFAEAIFNELHNANCINTFVKYDTLSQKVLSYKKISEHYQDNILRFISYFRSNYNTSFLTETMLEVLTRKGAEHMA